MEKKENKKERKKEGIIDQHRAALQQQQKEGNKMMPCRAVPRTAVLLLGLGRAEEGLLFFNVLDGGGAREWDE